MSIRQHRLTTQEQIKQKIVTLQGKAVTLVLANKTSVLGNLISFEEDGVTLENGRLKKFKFPYSQISELYFDERV